jgi:DnaJ-domain-containing protein 1
MPTFIFTSPEGKVYEVTGPEGATKEQAWGILQQKLGAAAASHKRVPMPFDLEGARKAGYSDAEIADYLAQRSNFDIDGALKAGYSHREIADRLAAVAKKPGEDQSVNKAVKGVHEYGTSMGVTPVGPTNKFGDESAAVAAGIAVGTLLVVLLARWLLSPWMRRYQQQRQAEKRHRQWADAWRQAEQEQGEERRRQAEQQQAEERRRQAQQEQAEYWRQYWRRQEEQEDDERRRRQAEQQQAEQERQAQQRRRQDEQEREAKKQRERQRERAAMHSEENEDWWNVLEVRRHASADEIRKAYRRKIQQCHPDRVAGLAPEFVELAERRTKALNAAYEEAMRARAA